MEIQAGSILLSTASMDDPIFHDTVVVIARHDENGTIGFVINKKLDHVLSDLEEFKSGPGIQLYNGGPVGDESLYFIHRRNDLIQGGELISGDIFLGGDFPKAISYIKSGIIKESEIKLLVGYCGWDHDELQGEIGEGSWTISEKASSSVFD